MPKGRLEAFSDGVLAIIITIMVLELHAPHDASWHALSDKLPEILGYALSFIYVGIYWNNHHHMFQAAKHVSGGALWANLHLLFWLSLVPFTTGWMTRNDYATNPVAVYGINLLLAAIAYTILTRVLIRGHGADSTLARAVGVDWKGWTSLAIYCTGVGTSFIHPFVGFGMYCVVALIWLVPDPRIERELVQKHHAEARNG
jgi:uncharacterized membrane protein